MDMFLQLLVTGIMVGGLYGLVALGLVIVYKSSRVLNLAHGGFLMILSYVAWQFAEPWGLPMWLSIVLVMGIAVVLGYGVERIILRPLTGQPILATIIVTLAMFEALEGIQTLGWAGLTQGYHNFIPSTAIALGPVFIEQHYLWSFVVAIVLFLAFLAFFRYSRHGLAMQIVSEDHQVARSLGIDVRTVFAQTWVIALIIAAIAGILYGALHVIDVENANIGLIKALPVVLLGGLESLPGALVGGIIVGIAEIVGAGYIDPLVGGGSADIIPLTLMLLILLIKPYGLFGWVRIERI
ncbi:MAG: branched-chain amino acid ABC transporter permease [Chloroflexi bacterium]|nr:branched-chain amino acid ABC transporter permease [Chloroflexota bacterium]